MRSEPSAGRIPPGMVPKRPAALAQDASNADQTEKPAIRTEAAPTASVSQATSENPILGRWLCDQITTPSGQGTSCASPNQGMDLNFTLETETQIAHNAGHVIEMPMHVMSYDINKEANGGFLVKVSGSSDNLGLGPMPFKNIYHISPDGKHMTYDQYKADTGAMEWTHDESK